MFVPRQDHFRHDVGGRKRALRLQRGCQRLYETVAIEAVGVLARVVPDKRLAARHQQRIAGQRQRIHDGYVLADLQGARGEWIGGQPHAWDRKIANLPDGRRQVLGSGCGVEQTRGQRQRHLVGIADAIRSYITIGAK